MSRGRYPREIDAALDRLGLSARAASIRAQGSPEMIRDMRRGHVPSVERLRSLCEVLDLDFFVGPRRFRDARAGSPTFVEHAGADGAGAGPTHGGRRRQPGFRRSLVRIASRRAVASPAAEGESTPAASSPWSDPPPSDRIRNAGMEREFGWPASGRSWEGADRIEARNLVGDVSRRTRRPRQ